MPFVNSQTQGLNRWGTGQAEFHPVVRGSILGSFGESRPFVENQADEATAVG